MATPAEPKPDAAGPDSATAPDDVIFVEMTSEPLRVEKYVGLVTHTGAGGISVFVGTTRDNFEGKHVVRLEYEAYAGMAESKLREVCRDAIAKWPDVKRAAVAHRTGLVPVCEASVVVAVSSPHRRDAIEACHYIIDELKARVPIWKKEVYGGAVGGEGKEDSAWKKNKEWVPLGKEAEG